MAPENIWLILFSREGVATFSSAVFDELTNFKDIGINIDEDYSVSTVDKKGNPVGDASMGQSRVAAVSLIAGLSKASVTRAPILIDSPMVGLDTEHQSKLYAFISKLADQVILLVPPGEWIEDEHRKIKDIKNNIVGEITLEKTTETQLQIHDGYHQKFLKSR